MVLPALRSIWESPIEPESTIPFYSFETSHATFPLAPMLISVNSSFFNYGASILIYRVGKLLLIRNKMGGIVAELAAYFFIIGHHMFFFIEVDRKGASVSIFLTLLAFYALYSGKESESAIGLRNYYVPQTHRIFLACFILSIATMADPKAVSLFTFILFYLGNKVLLSSGNFPALLKCLIVCAWSLLIFFIPYFTVAMWQPYELHCIPRLNRSNELAPWCIDTWPNVHFSIKARFNEIIRLHPLEDYHQVAACLIILYSYIIY